jgi:hypothetical protein
MINSNMGGIINGVNPSEYEPDAPIPREYTGNMSAPDQAQVTRDGVKLLYDNVKELPKDIYSRRGFVRSLTTFSEQYTRLRDKSNKVPDKETSLKVVEMIATDEFKDIVLDPAVSPNEFKNTTKLAEMVGTEFVDTVLDIGADLKGKQAPPVPIPGNEVNFADPYAGYTAGVRDNRGQNDVPLGMMINLTWQGDRAVLGLVPENSVLGLQFPVNRDILKGQVDKLNAKYSKRLTNLVRANAHSTPTDNYAASAAYLDEQLNNARVRLWE